LVRFGRAIVGLAVIVGASTASSSAASRSGAGAGHNYAIDIGVVLFAAVMAVISWFVTSWHVEGDALQVQTGLIRRKVIRVPLSRVQAVDVVEPLVARILGLAEVRVRTGGGSDADARLMYLREDEAAEVRGRLLALVHGLPDSTPAPPEQALFSLDNRRFITSVLLTGATLSSALGVVAFVVLAVSGPDARAALAATGTTVVIYLFGLASRVVRRIASEWSFQVARAPDGLRVRCGFASRVAETIPTGRIQAVRMLEPLWWRPLGWCRLELHLAGGVTKARRQPSSAVRRALLPVGTRQQAELLLGLVMPGYDVPLERPPRAAMARSPFSYHFLAAGSSAQCARSVSGRVRRLTEWTPLPKVQSIRSVQGPFERALGLSTLHLDVAGHRAHVSWFHFGVDRTAELMARLPGECADARAREPVPPRAASLAPAPAPVPGAGSGSAGTAPPYLPPPPPAHLPPPPAGLPREP
jgi:putative membrane protein